MAVLYHNCGYARSLLPLYPGLGLRAYESLTPPPYGDTVLAEAVRAFGRGTTLLGGIDQLDLLRTGEAHEIQTAIRKRTGHGAGALPLHPGHHGLLQREHAGGQDPAAG